MDENPMRPSRPRRQPPPVLPADTRVAGYEVVRRLGAGGYGTVYLASGGTSRVALKLLPLESSQGWEDREVDVLRRMKHPCVVRLLGYVDWPEEAPHFRVLIMEYVEGLPLDECVRRNNPSALGVVELLLLPLMEAMEAVHTAGVLHRDVKASNILVRASNGKPVLVDFGAGDYAGAPTVTTSVLPPGTPEYRGPEAWDFFRRHVGEAGVSYEPTPADDLWAVGVLLYWMLTDRLPFTGRDFLAIGTAVLNDRPVPPRELNPWVPEALERVCLRMLEKSPGARYADAREVRLALSALKAEADASWHEPLFEPHGPHNDTTRPMGQLARGQDLQMRLSRLARQPPLRGEAATVRATAPGAGARPWWRLGGLAVGVLALAAALWLLPPWMEGVFPGVTLATLPVMSPEPFPIQWDTFFPDVVPPRKPPHVAGDAAPDGGAVAAAVHNDRHSENDMSEKNTPTRPPPPSRTPKARPSIKTCLSLGAAAALAAGCAPMSPIGRAFIAAADLPGRDYAPEDLAALIECPPEAIKAMKENDVAIGSVHKDSVFYYPGVDTHWNLPYPKLPATTPVPLSWTGVHIRIPWGRFNTDAIIIGSSVILGDRVYSRLIAYNGPFGDDRHLPVCMEVWHEGKLGTPIAGPVPNEPAQVMLPPRIHLKAVSKYNN